MFTKKIVSLALAGLITVGGMGLSAFAAEPENTSVQNNGMSMQEFKESGKTIEGLQAVKAQLDEKGITLAEAKANFEQKLNQFAQNSGITVEQAKEVIANLKENGKTFEGLKNAKDAKDELSNTPL